MPTTTKQRQSPRLYHRVRQADPEHGIAHGHFTDDQVRILRSWLAAQMLMVWHQVRSGFSVRYTSKQYLDGMGMLVRELCGPRSRTWKQFRRMTARL